MIYETKELIGKETKLVAVVTDSAVDIPNTKYNTRKKRKGPLP